MSEQDARQQIAELKAVIAHCAGLDAYVVKALRAEIQRIEISLSVAPAAAAYAAAVAAERAAKRSSC